jgi:hypothetical protein
MRAIASLFLRARHWQIFALLCGTYICGQVAIPIVLPSLALKDLKDALLAEAAMLPFIICFMGWFWAIGSLLYNSVEPNGRADFGGFHFATVFLAVFLTTALPIFVNATGNVAGVLGILTFLAGLSLIYICYFVARTLASIDKRREIGLNDYIGPLVLLCFAPIGVWVIQPQINQLYAKSR